MNFTNGLLTFKPALNEILGGFGQTVRLSLSVADNSGNWLSNFTWSFELEREPIAKTEVLVVSNAPPGLVLTATNGDLFAYSFTGPRSGLSNGTILVSADTNFTIRFTNLTTGAIITCPGSTYVYNQWSVVLRALLTKIEAGASSNIVFDVTNHNPFTAMFRFEFAAVVVIEWAEPSCKLQCATELHNDPLLNVWTDVPGATSPYTTAASLDKKFFRLICLGNCP